MNKAPPAKARRAVITSVITNSVLALIKVSAGVIGNSYALVADGIESGLDVLGSLIAWRGIRVAHKPSNEKYPYGRGKAEPLAAVMIALILIGAALVLAIESIREILTPHHAPASFTLIVLVAVVITKEFLFRKILKTADELESTALQNDAWHHRSDAITSGAAFVGISLALLGGPGWEAADDFAALLAAGIIAWNGYSLLQSPLHELLDAATNPSLEQDAAQIASQITGVEAVEKCRARKSGMYYLIEIHIMVDGAMSVRDGHEIARQVRRALCNSALQIRDALVHIEPLA